MTLKELLEAVKDQNLTQNDIQKYRDDLIHIKKDLHTHIANCKKQRALFIMNHRPTEQISVAAREMAWDALI